MTRIIAIANHKGGVGKTTTAINLSSALAHFSRKVLIVDIDPQANTTRGLGFDPSLTSKSIFEVLDGSVDINSVLKKTAIKDLTLLPSKIFVSPINEFVNNSEEDPYYRLKKAFSSLKKTYDYIIIDCPPSLGFLTVNALVSANTILVPVQCEYFAMDAINSMLGTISRIQSQYNPDLGIEGFLMTMYDAKTSLGTQISSQVRSLFKENTFLTQIPRNVSIPESNLRGLPVTVYRPTSSGSLAYYSLAKEVMDKENQ